jgi:uncharacterized protein
MFATSPDLATLAVVIAGALIAGFVTGLAGFGTALVASGLWLHALPASAVPPLVALSSVAAQIVSLITVRKAFDWSRALPYLAGGALGVPLGTVALAAASPPLLRTSVGAFLSIYAICQLLRRSKREIGAWGGTCADAIIGIGGGFLGGFAGLSGPLPLIWLQLRGGEPDRQRAIYQPFNLIVLTLASVAMAVRGQITMPVLGIASLSLPATLLGAWIGANVYVGVTAQTFQRVVLGLLLASGCILLGQALTP